jgi:outer membrane protein insertion porin family
MRGLRAALAAACLVLIASPAVSDVVDYIGKPIGAVHIELEGQESTDPKLLAVVETRIGQPLSMAAVRESVTHLFSLGRFDGVQVRADLAEGRVTLRYSLEPVHLVARLDFAGSIKLPGIDPSRLRSAVVERFGASPPVGRAADVARLIGEELQQRGYLHATVVPRVGIEHAPERATLAFTIDAGPRTYLETIDVVGAPGIPLPSFLAALGVSRGAPYQPDLLRQRIDKYVAGRRAKGFYEASVGPAIRLADGDRVANLTLTVAPGPRVRVVFAGDALPSDKHAELVPVEREGSVDEDLLEDSSNRIEEFLRTQGYRDAAAPHTRTEKDGELLITFTVKKGSLSRVSRVEISGNASVPVGEFAPGLRLRDGQPFSAARLDADLATVESLYHRRGFTAAKADAAVEQDPATRGAAQVPVLVRITIREGVRTLVGSVGIVGNQSVPEATLRPSLGLQSGQPYFQPQIAVDRDALQLQYANLGYQSATVEASPGTSADGTRADVVFSVHEGPRIFVDHVLIVGNTRTSTPTIERELQVKTGDPLGLQAVTESQRRLAALGLFRRSRITELRHGDETTRDLLVTVEEAPVTTVGYGGGVEAYEVIRAGSQSGAAETQIDFAPRAFAELTRRNLFGKNRSINLFGRISLHAKNYTTVPGAADAGDGTGFTEYRTLATFREPRVLNTGADASLTGVFEQQRRSSFNFGRKSFIAEAGRRLAHRVSVSGSYQIQKTELFDAKPDPANQLLIDRLFPQVLLSSFGASIARDTRDDVVDPGAGGYLSANGQIAARKIGSEVGLAKTFLTAQAFHTLPHTNRVVLAGNARVGLATGFPREGVTDDTGQPTLPASERFFAGGDTMRGFALDQLGAPSTIDKNGFPIGGNALLILNAELRAPVRGGLGVVGFFDTGNVFARSSDFNLGDLRSALGFGLRYKSPIGPIRLDLGFKLKRHTVAGRREDLTAFHISLGQAF